MAKHTCAIDLNFVFPTKGHKLVIRVSPGTTVLTLVAFPWQVSDRYLLTKRVISSQWQGRDYYTRHKAGKTSALNTLSQPGTHVAFPGSELIESGPGPKTISSHRLHSHQSASGKLLPLIYGFSLSLIRTRDLPLSAITLSESAERQKT